VRRPFLFEFMDLRWLPQSVRRTLRDILECGNARPFRSYYRWVADESLASADRASLDTLVELGAGTAPIAREILRRDVASTNAATVEVTDLNPDADRYDDLRRRHGDRVRPVCQSVDFSRPRASWDVRTGLVLSATFHHIPYAERRRVLRVLSASGSRVMIFEPLRCNVVSALFVFCSIVPAMLCPLVYLRRPGVWRRFLWCWLLPVAPLMFVWDGLASVARCWTEPQWEQALADAGVDRATVTIETSAVCTCVRWHGRPADPADTTADAAA